MSLKLVQVLNTFSVSLWSGYVFDKFDWYLCTFDRLKCSSNVGLRLIQCEDSLVGTFLCKKLLWLMQKEVIQRCKQKWIFKLRHKVYLKSTK